MGVVNPAFSDIGPPVELDDIIVTGQRRPRDSMQGSILGQMFRTGQALTYGVLHDAIGKGVPWLLGGVTDVVTSTVETVVSAPQRVVALGYDAITAVGNGVSGRGFKPNEHNPVREAMPQTVNIAGFQMRYGAADHPLSRLIGHPAQSFAARMENWGDNHLGEWLTYPVGLQNFEMRIKEGGGLFDIEYTFNERAGEGAEWYTSTSRMTSALAVGNVLDPTNLIPGAAIASKGGKGAKLLGTGMRLSDDTAQIIRNSALAYNAADISIGATYLPAELLSQTDGAQSNSVSNVYDILLDPNGLETSHGRSLMQRSLNRVFASTADISSQGEGGYSMSATALPLDGNLNSHAGDPSDTLALRLRMLGDTEDNISSGTVKAEMKLQRGFNQLVRSYIANPDMQLTTSQSALVQLMMVRDDTVSKGEALATEVPLTDKNANRAMLDGYISRHYGLDMEHVRNGGSEHIRGEFTSAASGAIASLDLANAQLGVAIAGVEGTEREARAAAQESTTRMNSIARFGFAPDGSSF